MEKEKKKFPTKLEIILEMVFLAVVIGSMEGYSANLRPFRKDVVIDVSFSAYLEDGKKQFGDNIGSYALAAWTYPGARLGATMHNYMLTDNSKK